MAIRFHQSQAEMSKREDAVTPAFHVVWLLHLLLGSQQCSQPSGALKFWLLQALSGIWQCLQLTLITDFGVHSCYKQFQKLGDASNNLFHLATNAGIWVLLVISKEFLAMLLASTVSWGYTNGRLKNF